VISESQEAQVTLLTRTIRNGVDADELSALRGRMEDEPERAALGFRAVNRWIDGTHSVSAVGAIEGADRAVVARSHSFRLDADAPAGLLGTDRGPDPSELLLHALAACLTRSVVHTATTRRIALATVESTVSGAVDVRGLLGLPGSAGAGLDHVGAAVRVTGDAPVAELVALVRHAAAASPVHAALGIDVALRVAAS
jgi:uncharacterized OsmC-like protein